MVERQTTRRPGRVRRHRRRTRACPRAKYFGEISDQQLGQTLRILGHLDHRPIAGGEDADEGRKAEEQRKVPRHDDAYHAERLRHDAIARAGENEEIDPPAARLHPALHPLGGVASSVENPEHLGEQGLEFAAIAVVRIDRGDDRGLIVLDEAAEGLQIRDPLRMRGLRRLEIGGPLGGEAGLEFDRDGELGNAGASWRTWPLRVAARIALADAADHAYLACASSASMSEVDPTGRGRKGSRPAGARSPTVGFGGVALPPCAGAAYRENSTPVRDGAQS